MSIIFAPTGYFVFKINVIIMKTMPIAITVIPIGFFNVNYLGEK